MNETVNEKPLTRFNHELLSLNRFWSMTESGDIAWLMDNGTVWFKPFSVQVVTSEIKKNNGLYTFRILIDKGDAMVNLILSYNSIPRALMARDQMVSLVNQRDLLFRSQVVQNTGSPVPPSFFEKVKSFFKRK